jgi:N-acetylneuraminic acid mutarotase
MDYHHRLSWARGPFAALLLSAILAAPGQAGEWGRKADLPAAHSEFAVAELDGKIYVISGYEIGDVVAGAVHVYDNATDRWAPGPPLPKPAHHLTAAAVDGKIYAIGGQSLSIFGGGFLDNVWALDPAQGAWVARAPLPRARGGGVAVALDGKIYVAGGRPPHGQDFAVYDPAGDSWTVLADMPSQRNHIAGAAIAGKVWVAGGRLGRAWAGAAPLPQPRSGINGIAARGCFHVWGGEGGDGMFPDHTVYDPRADRWTRLADMPAPVHGVTGAAFVDGLIHMPGGGLGVGGRSPGTLHQTYRPDMVCE